MLHILLLILKIIGIILLVIIGITLVLAGTVLFVPVRYRLKTETKNGMKELRTEARFSWLLHLISAYVTYDEQEIDYHVRIGWKTFNASEDEPHKELTTQDEEVHRPEQGAHAEETSRGEEVNRGKEVHQGEDAPRGEKLSSKKPVKKDNWFKKIKCTIKEIYGKIKDIKEFLLEETHIQAFLRLKKEIIFFIRKIKPDKINGYVRFGLEDPYNTGRVLAVLSVLYPFYGENFQVYPEFEREIIEGDVFLKGRIHFMHLLWFLVKIYFDKNVKIAYKNFKELKG